MRLILFFILGVFLWAGTASIKFPQQSSMVTASSGPTCSGKSEERLMEYLSKGIITSILDNGRILNIGLSPEWANLLPSMQQKTYDTVVCYSQSQHRPFRFLLTQ